MKNTDETLPNTSPKRMAVLCCFIDEMGKFPGGCGYGMAMIFISSSNLPKRHHGAKEGCLLLEYLHQAFEAYAYRPFPMKYVMNGPRCKGALLTWLSMRQGRKQIDLISRAIESDYRPENLNKLCADAAAVVCRNNTHDAKRLASTLEACWPLHPVVYLSCLAPISRRRFGQNQRSIFGFSELVGNCMGFQDFLKACQRG